MPAALRRIKAHPKEVKEEAVKRLAQGQGYRAVARDLGLHPSSVKNWMAIPNKINVIREITQAAAKSAIDRELAHASKNIRGTIAEVVGQQAQLLASKPAKTIRELRNTPDRQGLAAVAKTVAETASAVFGWGSEGPAGGVNYTDFAKMDAIEVESTPVVCDTVPEVDNRTVEEQKQ